MSHVRHPAPLNQFYRLQYDEVAKRWVKATRWNHIHVIAGRVINFDGLLCMAAEGAVALDAHTLGTLRVSPGRLHDYQDDMSGGIGVDDVDVAWHRLAGVDLLTPDNVGWLDLGDFLGERRHIIIGVEYAKVVGERLQLGTFDHAIGFDDWKSGGMWLRYDSLDTNAKWITPSNYRAAAEALALRVRGSKARLFVGLTRIRPAVVAPYMVTIRPVPPATTRKFGLYTVTNGVVTGVRIAETGGFSAHATGRDDYPYPGHSRQDLVRLLDGPVNVRGKYVRFGYVVED